MPALLSEESQMKLSFNHLNLVFYFFIQDSCSIHWGTLSATPLSYIIISNCHLFLFLFFHYLSPLPFPLNSIWSTWVYSSFWVHLGENFPTHFFLMITPLYQQRWPFHFFLWAEFCFFFSWRKGAPFENDYLQWSGAVCD